MVTGTISIKRFGSTEEIFTHQICNSAIIDGQLRVYLDGGFTQLSLQKNTIYTVAITQLNSQESMQVMCLFQYYSFNMGSTTVQDETGNISEGMAVLDNTITFQIVN